MSWPKPYVSGLMVTQKMAAESPQKRAQIASVMGWPLTWQQFYEREHQEYSRRKWDGQVLRVWAEEQWYADRRPYFRVYPLIEKKLLALRGKMTVGEMRMPYPSIEINTQRRTMLFHKSDDRCTLVAETTGDDFVLLAAPLETTIDQCAAAREQISDWHGASDASKDIAGECIRIAIGVCLLATDPKIVAPVILDKHRRDDMRPEEIERRAAQAISRTGRVGFDVGRDIERMPVTSHYRTGCPAIYHVGKSHESYPRGGVLDREPVLLWRSGAVVNADRTVRVPTGFHGAAASD